jgi:hypothetical protein
MRLRECWWEGARRAAAGERAEGARRPRQRVAGGRDSNVWAIGVAEELRTGGRELAQAGIQGVGYVCDVGTRCMSDAADQLPPRAGIDCWISTGTPAKGDVLHALL